MSRITLPSACGLTFCPGWNGFSQAQRARAACTRIRYRRGGSAERKIVMLSARSDSTDSADRLNVRDVGFASDTRSSLKNRTALSDSAVARP